MRFISRHIGCSILLLLVVLVLALSVFSGGQAVQIGYEPMAQVMEDCAECSDGEAMDCERHCVSGPMQVQRLEPVEAGFLSRWKCADVMADRLVGLTPPPLLGPPKILS